MTTASMIPKSYGCQFNVHCGSSQCVSLRVCFDGFVKQLSVVVVLVVVLLFLLFASLDYNPGLGVLPVDISIGAVCCCITQFSVPGCHRPDSRACLQFGHTVGHMQ